MSCIHFQHVSEKETGHVHVNNFFFFFFFFFFLCFFFLFFFFFFFSTFPTSSPYFQLPPPLRSFLKSNHWFAEALGQTSTDVVMPSPTSSYTMAPTSSQAAQPTTKVPTHIAPTQSTTERETTTPTPDTKKPSKLIFQFLDASNHFWAYLSVILNSTSPVMSKTNQSAFSL